MSDLSKALAMSEEMVLDGNTYALAPLNFEIQGAFCVWLKKRSLNEIQKARPDMDQDDYREALAQHFRDRGAGVYDFVGPLALQTYLRTYEGRKHLLYLRLKHSDTTMTEERAGDLFDRYAEEIMSVAKSMDHDPNSTAPEKAATPGTT